MIANPEVQGGCNHGILGFSPVRAEISRFFSQTALHLDFSSHFRKSWPRPTNKREEAEKAEALGKQLHQALSSKKEDSIILPLITPGAARWQNKDGWIALHYAAGFYGSSASETVVRRLLQAFPDGAKTADNENNLPLHRAAWDLASQEVVQLLVQAYPEGKKARGKSGGTPSYDCSVTTAGSPLAAVKQGATCCVVLVNSPEGRAAVCAACCRRYV